MEAFHLSAFQKGTWPLPRQRSIWRLHLNQRSLYSIPRVKKDIRELENMSVPLHIRNPVTSLMKDIGYGRIINTHMIIRPLCEEEYLPENLEEELTIIPLNRDLKRD